MITIGPYRLHLMPTYQRIQGQRDRERRGKPKYNVIFAVKILYASMCAFLPRVVFAPDGRAIPLLQLGDPAIRSTLRLIQNSVYKLVTELTFPR